MRRTNAALVVFLLMAVSAWAADPPWHARLQYIEACSCDLFCPCFFNEHASHQGTGEHKCNFNNVVKVEQARYGNLDLRGMKVWMSGDLGADWATKGQADWLVVTFEPSATQQQKDAMMAILSKLYPVKWTSVQFDTSPIQWSISADGKTAEARMENGKGEVKLTRFDYAPGKPAQVTARYFASTWNSPFTLYHSDHFYKGFGQAYSPKHANGFTVTVEATSDGKRVRMTKGKSGRPAAD